MSAYYNEIEPAAAHVLRALIADGIIAPGDVDERSIKDVQPNDIKRYTQVHFFAGGGLWSVAARLAGWPDDRSLWTGSCPCQPFSVAGKGAGEDDPRHLWPDFFRLIRSCRPSIVVGEQVAGAAGYRWFDGVASDLEGENYASRAVDIPACAIDAPHIRQRLYWIASDLPNANGAEPGCGEQRFQSPDRSHHGDAAEQERATVHDMEHSACIGRGEGRPEHEVWGGRSAVAGTSGGDLAKSDGSRSTPWLSAQARRGEGVAEIVDHGSGGQHGPWEKRNGSFWSDNEWLTGADGKARRSKPGVRLLVDGLPGRVGLLRIGGNAIVPVLASEIIQALMEVYP